VGANAPSHSPLLVAKATLVNAKRSLVAFATHRNGMGFPSFTEEISYSPVGHLSTPR